MLSPRLSLSSLCVPPPHTVCLALSPLSPPMHQLASALYFPPCLSSSLLSSPLIRLSPLLPLFHPLLILKPPWWTDNRPAVLRPWVPASAKVTKVSEPESTCLCVQRLCVCLTVGWTCRKCWQLPTNIRGAQLLSESYITFSRDSCVWENVVKTPPRCVDNRYGR